MVFSALLLGAQHKKGSVIKTPENSSAVFLGKAFNGIPALLWGGQLMERSSLPVTVAQSN